MVRKEINKYSLRYSSDFIKCLIFTEIEFLFYAYSELLANISLFEITPG